MKTQSIASRILVSSIAIAALASPAIAQTITKADNTDALGLNTSWAGGTAPGSGNIADWSGTYNTAGSLGAALPGSALSWQGVSVGNITGTAAGLVSIGGTAGAVTGSNLTIGSSGINLSGANQNLVINAATLNFNTSQTWNLATGRNLRFGITGTGSANANVDGSSASALISISGGGVVDANQGGSGGFADAAGFAGFAGKWQVDSGATLRGIRNGATAWGNNTSPDAITLNGGTLAVGGISGTQGNWTWNTPVTLSASTTSAIDQQLFTGAGRSLKLMGAMTGDATTNLVFKETGANDSFGNDDLAYIIAVDNPNLAGTVTIWGDGALENNIVGRLTSVRIGGVNGATDISTGAGAAGTLGTATIVNNGVLTLSRNDTWTFANGLSGAGTLRIGGGVSGASTQVVTISGSKTYTGATTVSQGRLNLTGSLTSAITVASGASLSGNGGTTGLLTLASGGRLALAGGGTTTSITSNGATFSGLNDVFFLAPPVATTVYDVFTYGTGTLTTPENLVVPYRGDLANDPLNQKYTFTAGEFGATRTWDTTDGFWERGVDANFAEGDKLFYTGDIVVFNNPAAPSTVTKIGSLAPASMIVTNTNGYTFDGSGFLTGTMTLTKTGTGSLTLATANSYTGGTTLRQGTIVAGNNNALGTGGTITLNDTGTGSNNTTLNIDATAGNVNVPRPIVIANEGTGTTSLGNASTANNNQAIFSGAITLNKAVTLMNSGFGDRLQFSGGISGTGDITVDGVSNTKKTIFITTANTFSGNIHVTGNGRLQLGDGATSTINLIPDSANVNLNTAGGVFNLAKNGNNETINALNGVAGTSVNGIAGNDTLTVGGNGGSGSFAGTISGSVGITKAGAGTQILSGTNSFTGAIQINEGTLAISGSTTTSGNLNSVAASTLAATGSALNYASGSILGTLTGSATVTRGGTADTASQFTTAGALAFDGTLRLRGSTPSTTPAAMQGGTGRFWLNSATGSQLAGTKFFLDTGASATNGQDIIIGDWDANGTRTLTLSGLQGFGTIRTDAGGEGVRNVIVDQSGGDTIFNGMLLSHRSGAGVNRSISFEKKGSGSLTMAGIVGIQTQGASGSAPLTVTVTGGTLTLTAANTYTGATTVNGGTLLVNNATGSGTGTGTVTVTTGTLGGTGTIGGSVIVATAGNVAPGTSAGTLSVSGNLDLSAMAAGAGKLQFELDALAGTNDRINVTGTVALGTLALDDLEITDLGDLEPGTYTLITSSGLTGSVDGGVALIAPGFNGQLQPSGSDVQLVVTATGGTTFADWIDGFFPGETDANIIGAGADPDNDGIPNSAEMVIGGDPKDGMDTALLPTLELVTDPVSSPAIPTGDYLLFTYRRTAESETAGVTAGCETDTDLVGSWTPAINAVSGVVIQEDLNFTFTPAAPANTDRVRVYVPRGSNEELFGRLKVQVP